MPIMISNCTALNDRDSKADFLFLDPADFAKKQVPWALQPGKVPIDSESKLRELQTWRRNVVRILHGHIVPYLASHDIQRQSTPVFRTEYLADPPSQRVAGITEIVEQILIRADPLTQVVTLGVCKKWRDISLFVMKRTMHTEIHNTGLSCSPVRYGDDVPPGVCFQPPHQDEIDYMNHEIAMDEDLIRDGIYRGIRRLERDRIHKPPYDRLAHPDIIKTVYYPGRISQRADMPRDETQWIARFYVDQLSWNGIHARSLLPRVPPRQRATPKWIDLTQFQFNPRFTGLFRDTFAIVNGIGEVALEASDVEGHAVGWHNLPDASMKYLDEQFVTQPPIIALNISIWVPQHLAHKPRPRQPLHMIAVRNDSGIRIGELLSAMKRTMKPAVEHWLYWASLMCEAVEQVHWDQDIWIVDSKPKILISLDPEQREGTQDVSIHHLSSFHALAGRDERQAAWMPRSLIKHRFDHASQQAFEESFHRIYSRP